MNDLLNLELSNYLAYQQLYIVAKQKFWEPLLGYLQHESVQELEHYNKLRDFMLQEKMTITLAPSVHPVPELATPLALVEFIYQLEIKTENAIKALKTECRIQNLFMDEVLLTQHKSTCEALEMVEFAKVTKDMFLLAFSMKK